MPESEDDIDPAGLRKDGSDSSASGRVTRIEAYERRVWHAPLPPPSLLRDYNEAFPGCAERIVAMTEAESRERYEANRHQRESLRRIIDGDVYSQKVGLWLAFILALLVILVGAFLIYTGKLAWGTGLISLPLVSLVGLFIYGRTSQTKDLRKPTPADLDSDEQEQPSLPFPES